MTAIAAKAANAIIHPHGRRLEESVVVGDRGHDEHERDQGDEVDSDPCDPRPAEDPPPVQDLERQERDQQGRQRLEGEAGEHLHAELVPEALVV